MQKKIFALGKRIENNDVGMFVKELQINYQFLYNEVSDQKNQIKGMEAKLMHYRKIENSLQEAMVSAQKVSEDKIAKAEQKAREIEKNAYKKADTIICDAKNELESIKKDIESFNKAYAMYQKKYREFVNGQLRFIEEAERFIQDEDILSSFDVNSIEDYNEPSNDEEEESYSSRYEYENKSTEDDSVNFNLDLSDDSEDSIDSIEEETLEMEEEPEVEMQEDENVVQVPKTEEKITLDEVIEEYSAKESASDEDTKALDEYLSSGISTSEEDVEDVEDVEETIEENSNESELNDDLNLTKESESIKMDFIKNDLMKADFMKEEVVNEQISMEEQVADIGDAPQVNSIMQEIPIANVDEDKIIAKQPKEESLEDILDSVTSDETLQLNIKNDANNNMVDDSIEVDFKGEYGKEIEKEASFDLPTLDMDSMGFDDITLDDSITSLPEIEIDVPKVTEEKPLDEPNLSINNNINLLNFNQTMFGNTKKKADKNADILKSMNLTSSKEERKESIKNYESAFTQDLLASNMAMMNNMNKNEEAAEKVPTPANDRPGLGGNNGLSQGTLQGLDGNNSLQPSLQGLGGSNPTPGGLQGLGGNAGLQGNSLGSMPNGASLPNATSAGRKPMF